MKKDIINALRRMDVKWAGNQIEYLQNVDSTNDYAKKMAMDGGVHGLVVSAEEQSGGKGRRGRSWVTPAQTAIAMSMVLRPDMRPDKASMLTLVAGLAVAQAIREVTNLPAFLKWPNDVVIHGKKVTGILTEMTMRNAEIDFVILGIGINVNVTEFPEELAGIATSLLLESGKKVDRTELMAACLKYFEKDYEVFMKDENLSGLKDAYEQILANRDRHVRVLEPGSEYAGIARGIDEAGQLLVEKEDGTVTKVYAGEVSVRGIYEYV